MNGLPTSQRGRRISYNEGCFAPADKDFFQALSSLKETVGQQLAEGAYQLALATLARFRPAVDVFFDQVMIMDKDQRSAKPPEHAS